MMTASPRTVKSKAVTPAKTVPVSKTVAVVTEKLSIPATIEEATGKLGALHKLLTATQWEKAAIVYAFTYVGKPGRKVSEGIPSDTYTITAFADLGIAGLKDRPEVARWRKAWTDSSGDNGIKPGSLYVPPVEAFPGLGTVAEAAEKFSTDGKAVMDELTDDAQLAAALYAVKNKAIAKIVLAAIKAAMDDKADSGDPAEVTFDSSFKKVFGGPVQAGLDFLVAGAGHHNGDEAVILDGAMRKALFQFTEIEARNKTTLVAHIAKKEEEDIAASEKDLKARK